MNPASSAFAPVKDKGGICVIARFRPLPDPQSPTSLIINDSYHCSITYAKEGNNRRQSQGNYGPTNTINPRMQDFTFDYILGPNCTQEDVFKTAAEPTIKDFLEGYNGTIFCYGQTGSGKTHTMHGPQDSEQKGLVPRIIARIFEWIDSKRKPKSDSRRMSMSDTSSDSDGDQDVVFKVSYIEIYNEKVYDLFGEEASRDSSSSLKIRGHPQKGFFVAGATELFIDDQKELLNAINEGSKNRAVASTNMNRDSSRSHSVLILELNQLSVVDRSTLTSRLFLVDLAGSECIEKTGATGTVLKEASNINKSLTTLGLVMTKLADGNHHIPYRDSALTMLLKDSLGGNSKTTLIINCSMEEGNSSETKSTLQFGTRAKKIINKPTINKTMTHAQLTSELKKAETYTSYLLSEGTLLRDVFLKESFINKQIINQTIDENNHQNGQNNHQINQINQIDQNNQQKQVQKITKLSIKYDILNERISELKQASVNTSRDDVVQRCNEVVGLILQRLENLVFDSEISMNAAEKVKNAEEQYQKLKIEYQLENQRMQNINETLQNEMESLKQKFKNEIQNLNLAVDAAKITQEDRKNNHNHLQTSLEIQLQTEIDLLRSSNENLKKMIEESNKAKPISQNEKNNHQEDQQFKKDDATDHKTDQNVDQKFNDFQVEISHLNDDQKEKIISILKSNEILTRENQKYVDNIKEYQTKIKSIENELFNVQSDHKSIILKNQELIHENESLIKQNQVLMQENNEKNQENVEISIKFEKLKSEFDSFLEQSITKSNENQISLDNLSKDLQQKSDILEQKNEENLKAQKEIERLQNEVATAQNECQVLSQMKESLLQVIEEHKKNNLRSNQQNGQNSNNPSKPASIVPNQVSIESNNSKHTHSSSKSSIDSPKRSKLKQILKLFFFVFCCIFAGLICVHMDRTMRGDPHHIFGSISFGIGTQENHLQSAKLSLAPFYHTLGLSPSEHPPNIITKAYHLMMKEYHPDKHRDDPNSQQNQQKIDDIQLAYRVLQGIHHNKPYDKDDQQDHIDDEKIRNEAKKDVENQKIQNCPILSESACQCPVCPVCHACIESHTTNDCPVCEQCAPAMSTLISTNLPDFIQNFLILDSTSQLLREDIIYVVVMTSQAEYQSAVKILNALSNLKQIEMQIKTNFVLLSKTPQNQLEINKLIELDQSESYSDYLNSDIYIFNLARNVGFRYNENTFDIKLNQWFHSSIAQINNAPIIDIPSEIADRTESEKEQNVANQNQNKEQNSKEEQYSKEGSIVLREYNPYVYAGSLGFVGLVGALVGYLGFWFTNM